MSDYVDVRVTALTSSSRYVPSFEPHNKLVMKAEWEQLCPFDR